MSWLDTLSEIRATDWSQAPEPEREAKAREVVMISGYASAAAAVVPVPFVDLALLLPFHSAMVMTIGHVFGRPLSDTEAKRVVVELGAVAGVTVGARAALTALKKTFLPGVGGVLAAPASFAGTWALGRVTIEYFKNPGLSRDELRKVFKDALTEAGKIFSKETFDRFRGKAPPDDADVSEVPSEDPPAESPPEAEAEVVSAPESPRAPPEPESKPAEPKKAAAPPQNGASDPAPSAPSAPSEPSSVRPKKRHL